MMAIPWQVSRIVRLDLRRRGLAVIPTLAIILGLQCPIQVFSLGNDSSDIPVKFFDETADISRIMSAPNMPTGPMGNSPPQQQSTSVQGDAMDYETMFNSFNTSLTSPYGSVTGQSPFNNIQTSPFNPQTSPSASSNLGLERLVLNESPSATFNAQGSQGNGSPNFGDFDAAMASFTTGMPIESMLDVTSIGEPSYFQSSNVVTEQTARLMRHYIDNLASWMDLSDSRTHFSTVVPKRALTSVYTLPTTLLILANLVERTSLFRSKTFIQRPWKWH
jgi:hypothetical protein